MKIKKKKNNYYFRSLFLKNFILKKRNYVYNNDNEKYDLLFDIYRDSIIKKLLEISELKRYFSINKLKKKKFNNRIFKKIYKKSIKKVIKNQIIFTTTKF